MLNVNIGLLGHVDSGKTALARALSRTASTAAFDKSPQSQSRGITLDLGFSAGEVSIEDGDKETCEVLRAAHLSKVLCTLVDCPGHASLIRTVVGGAQIIDAMVLVIDATKGVQAQTAECLVLGEVLAKPLVVVLNKIDAIQGATPAEKQSALAALRRKLQQTFRRTRWPTVKIVEVAAAPRASTGEIEPAVNTSAVLPQVLQVVDLVALKANKERESERSEHFYMLVDHCFAVRGQGTVFTGTVASGVVRVGDAVLVPELQTTRKVKSLQVFHKPVESAQSGDRVGLCITQFDPASMERGVLCSAAGSGRTLVSSSQLIARVRRVRYHPLPCDTHTKFHVIIGHTTVMGAMRFFSRPAHTNVQADGAATATFDPSIESAWVEELGDEVVVSYVPADSIAIVPGRPLSIAPTEREYYAILLLERPILAAPGASVIAMRLDVERENFCRIALAGTVCYILTEDSVPLATAAALSGRATDHPAGGNLLPAWRRLPVVRYRHRTLRVDRVLDSRSCIADGVVLLQPPGGGGGSSSPNSASAAAKQGRGGVTNEARPKAELFAEVQKFLRLAVVFEPDEVDTSAALSDGSGTGAVTGIIDSSFGKTGKVKLVFNAPVFCDVSTGPTAAVGGASKAVASSSRRNKKAAGGVDAEGRSASESVFLRPGRIILTLKKYPFALHSVLEQ